MNSVFIDGQNLHLGTKETGRAIDHTKFRIYLRDKYKVHEAYYFLGVVNEENQELYTGLQKAGFILCFREHTSTLLGHKKGNVDCDIVFTIMRKLYETDMIGNVILVSGDGDYKKLVDYLVKINRFTKILFPNKKFASSLYKRLGSEYYDHLDNPSIQKKICRQ